MADEVLLKAELEGIRQENRRLLERARKAEEALEVVRNPKYPRSGGFAMPYKLPADALYKYLCQHVPPMETLKAEELLAAFRELLPSIKTHFERRTSPGYPTRFKTPEA